MSLSIRYWLAERHIELAQLGHQSAHIAGIAFRLAQDMELKSLNAFSISSLTDVLELPLKAAWQVALPLSQVTVGLLRILSRKKPLKRNEGTWLTFQVAYLNALQGILEQEAHVGRPWMNRADVPINQNVDEPLSDPQLLAVLKTLRPGRLSDSQAEQALSVVADSFLVQQMNSLAIAWFMANGAEETEAYLLVQRLCHGLAGYLLAVIAENPLPLAQLQKFVRLGNVGSWQDSLDPDQVKAGAKRPTATLPLNLHREYYRASLLCALSEPLLGKPFSLPDLYVPLKGKVTQLEVTSDEFGKQTPMQSPKLQSQKAQDSSVDLMEWAMSQLDDKSSIAVIEAESGCGKTSFCQMWAARIAQNLYPNWMPVVISLGQVTLGETLEQTLENTLPVGRFTDTDGWLSPNSPPCVLIFDGLDELRGSPQRSRYLWTFMEQIIQFHAQDVGLSGRPHHKIVLTSRSRSLDCLIRKCRQSSTLPLPTQLRRIVIQPMGQDEFRQWFLNWAKVQSKSIAQRYFTFLKRGGVFQKRPAVQEIATLLSRPLMLFLMGLLHRDGWMDERIFQLNAAQVKFEIYDRITRWLLGEPAARNGSIPELIREGLAHAMRSSEAIANLLKGRHPQELRQQMQVAALTIVQTGCYQVPQVTINQRLTPNSTIHSLSQSLPSLFFRCELTKPRFDSEWSVIRHPPREQWTTDNSPRLAFSHPSLGEYLAAEEIAAQLIALTRTVLDQYGEVMFAIQEPVHVAQHLYALLGYGLLSPEMEELAIARLRQEERRNRNVFSFSVLFNRLYSFYRIYCRGRWLDEGIVHPAHSQFQRLGNPLSVLEIDAAVGLNVFLLLCVIAKQADVPFFPCGQPNIPQDFDADRLLSLIGRTVALSPTAFWQRVRHSLNQVELPQACLNRAMLAEANLSQANLSFAELIGINLAAANLQETNLLRANLGGANLVNANLCGAQLEGADLSGANLTGTNLTSANLANACLFQAQLDEETKSLAIRSGAIFSLEEFQNYNQSLVLTLSFGQFENDILGNEATIFIESAEGEPIFPDAQSRSDNHDDEGDTVQIEDLDESETIFD